MRSAVIQCGACGGGLEITDEHEGTKIPCPHCKRPVILKMPKVVSKLEKLAGYISGFFAACGILVFIGLLIGFVGAIGYGTYLLFTHPRAVLMIFLRLLILWPPSYLICGSVAFKLYERGHIRAVVEIISYPIAILCLILGWKFFNYLNFLMW